MIRIGTSGWQYDDWSGPFYPRGLPRARWLSFYAERFPAVELNRSFYRLPREEDFRRWRDATPEGFTMAVKASRFLTYLRRLRDPAEPVARLWSAARALGPRLGPVLFQLPPAFPVDLARLDRTLAALPEGMRAAFEFRDPSWHATAVFERLEMVGAALVWPDRPGERARLPLLSGWAYLRLHRGRTDAPGYPPAKLRRIASRIAALPAREVWAFCNNDKGGEAIRDARTLTRLVEDLGATVAHPPLRRGA
ncbi:MAG: DUF72 domain-containing protein [Actinomycetota bacterium]